MGTLHAEREWDLETWALEGCALSAEYLGHAERDPISGQHVGFFTHAERELLSHAERGAPGQNLQKLTISLFCLLSFGNLEYFLIQYACRSPSG